MKTLNKIILYIFSFIMIILSVVCLMLCFHWIEPSRIANLLTSIIQNEGAKNIFLAFNIVFIILSIKALFIHEREEQSSSGHGVLLENQNGKLMISKETIEDIVNSVANGYDNKAQETNVNVVLTQNNTIDIYLTLTVDQNTNIKELSTHLQQQIKEKVKQITDIDINEVNIKIKNITPANEKDQIKGV